MKRTAKCWMWSMPANIITKENPHKTMLYAYGHLLGSISWPSSQAPWSFVWCCCFVVVLMGILFHSFSPSHPFQAGGPPRHNGPISTHLLCTPTWFYLCFYSVPKTQNSLSSCLSLPLCPNHSLFCVLFCFFIYDSIIFPVTQAAVLGVMSISCSSFSCNPCFAKTFISIPHPFHSHCHHPG